MLQEIKLKIYKRRFLFLSLLYLSSFLPQCQHTRSAEEKELIENHKVQLFHTTSNKEELDFIKSRGFPASNEKDSTFTLSYRVAKDYAHFLSCIKKQEASIVGVLMDESEFKKFFKSGFKTRESLRKDKINLISTDIKASDEECKNHSDKEVFSEKLVNEHSDGTVSKFMGCITKLKGQSYGANHEFCIVTQNYWTLRNIDHQGHASTFTNCEKDFSGLTYGENGEFCATTKYYTVLGAEHSFKDQKATPFPNCHEKFAGKTFGPSHEFCAVEGYKVLSYANANGEILENFADCETSFRGISYGPKNEYCAVKEDT